MNVSLQKQNLPQISYPQGAPVTRQIQEDEFLAFAYDRLNHQPIACFLDSAGPIGPRSQHAMLSGAPIGLFFQYSDKVVWLNLRDQSRAEITIPQFDTWLTRFNQLGLGPNGPALFPLITYEAFNPWVRHSRPHPLWRQAPATWLLTADIWRYDRQTQRLTGCPEPDPPQVSWDAPLPSPAKPGWRETEAEYFHKIDHVQKDIYNGVYYQANLSQRFLTHSERRPLETYTTLRKLNPSPFMGLFKCGEAWVVSGSPERLVDKNRAHISARPIAGTKPRFKNDPTRDQASQQELLLSPKERAEHLMLVDLIRNDLGRVAAPGSVSVDEFCVIETYSHVHHLVSQVNASLREDATVYQLIASMFPGGTITGAPKISCIQRLSQLEEEARGPYTGAIGYIDTHHRLDLNILIRTLIQVGDQVCFHAGGGIVADSIHGSEYEETRHKCMALMEALGIRC